jgi:hypothetical protein
MTLPFDEKDFLSRSIYEHSDTRFQKDYDTHWQRLTGYKIKDWLHRPDSTGLTWGAFTDSCRSHMPNITRQELVTGEGTALSLQLVSTRAATELQPRVRGNLYSGESQMWAGIEVT